MVETHRDESLPLLPASPKHSISRSRVYAGVLLKHTQCSSLAVALLGTVTHWRGTKYLSFQERTVKRVWDNDHACLPPGTH